MDAIVKVGGSLAQNPAILRRLCIGLSECAKDYKIVIVPGGGKFADVVREFDLIFALSHKTSHKMAILGMDQYGLMLADITPGSCLASTVKEIEEFPKIGAAQILLPSHLMFEDNPLENSWDVTSDSIAAYVANQLGAAKLILVTDVDGVFTKNPQEHSDAKLIEKITVKELLEGSQRTSVDKFLPKLLLEYHFQCYVVNGKHPERVRSVLAGKSTICTEILPFSSK